MRLLRFVYLVAQDIATYAVLYVRYAWVRSAKDYESP